MKGDTSISGKSNSRRKRCGIKKGMDCRGISGWANYASFYCSVFTG